MLAGVGAGPSRCLGVSQPVLRTEAVSRRFQVGGGLFRRGRPLVAVDRVSIEIGEAETVALVGESGSGKSTLGRILLGLLEPTSGRVLYRGSDLFRLGGDERRRHRREVQVVFQDTGAALNPRRTVGASVEVPLRYNLGLPASVARGRAAELLEQVDLAAATFAHRLPHELSGGQRQRVGIARAMASEPRLVVADEPVSALDVSVRAQVLRVLRELKESRGLSYLFITHDLGVVRAIADRVIVMYLGAVIEQGRAASLLARPAHPYTRTLLDATPVPDPARRLEPRQRLRGVDIPSATDLPSGCRFRTRCPLAQEVCAEVIPPEVAFADGTVAACHFAERVREGHA